MCVLLAVLMAVLGTACGMVAQQSKPPATTANAVPKSYVPGDEAVQGTPLDRVVATVNGALILDSDINEELRFDAFNLNEEELGPTQSAAEAPSRSAALERLINRELILQQIRLEPNTEITDQDVDDAIMELRATIPACARYNCKTDAGWRAYLASIKVTEQAFKAHWRERMQVLAFTERRFRMGIRITPEEQKTYYEQKLLPKYRAAKVSAPPFDSISARIQEVLIEQQVSALLSDWLHSLRAQGSVIVLHPGEEAP
jgi:hypothetical protein